MSQPIFVCNLRVVCKQLGKVIDCPDTIEELAKVGSHMFNYESPVFFSCTGDVINSVSVLRDNDAVYVAKTGEMFFQDKASSRAKEFKAFAEQKKREREVFFKQPAGSSRPPKKKKTDPTCKISVGLVEWKLYQRKRYKTPKLVARKQVGHKMTASVCINKDATGDCVLQKAVDAFKLMDPDLATVENFHLLYPDLQSEVKLLPGSSEDFTPEKYVALLGTYYSKVKLYLVTDADWKECNLYRTKYQSLESDSESEMANDVDNAKFIGYLEGSKESEETFSDEKETSDDGSILCPVCQSVFSEIKSSLPLDCTLEDVTSNLLELSDPDNLYADIPLIVNLSADDQFQVLRSGPVDIVSLEQLPQATSETDDQIQLPPSLLPGGNLNQEHSPQVGNEREQQFQGQGHRFRQQHLHELAPEAVARSELQDRAENTEFFFQLRSDMEATTEKRQLGSDNWEATTEKRQPGSDN
ncbi:hypothetical protein ACROYT_G032743 [Oculina patagonica]